MKNPEDAVEKVLAGLRNGESTAGIESRILRAIKNRAAEHTAAGRRSRMPLWTSACAVSLGLFCLLALSHRPLQTPAVPTKNIAAASAPVPATIVPSRPGEGSAEPKANLASVKAKPRHITSVSRHAAQAASHPAPPLPLTRQEQLLLHVVHRIDPKELAMLNPGVKAMHDAKEKEQFREFFGPLTMRGDE